MSLLDSASLVVTPNAYKAGTLYSVIPNTTTGDLSVTRATGATRVNSAGAIETVGNNVPRIDYSNGTCPSILVEPQRTNSLLNSATVANQTIITGAVAYTLSFYGTGTITLSGTHTATVVGTGTTRKTYTFTPTAGILVLTVSGTCTRGQLEAGSYATSEIPTTSSIVTRNADVISKTGISSLIGQTEGTVFVDVNINNFASQTINPVIFSLFGNATIYMQMFASGYAEIIYSTGAGTQAYLYWGSVTNGRHKIGLGYKANDFVLYIDGVQIATDTSGSVDTLSSFYLGYNNSTFNPTANYNLTALWQTRLTNSQLQTLTTP